jgi:transposase
MDRIELTAAQEQELEQVFKRTEERRLRTRCQAVWMAARGRAGHEIAQDLGVHRTTMRWWVRSYREHGLGGLPIQWAPGPQARIPEEVAPRIVAGVKGGPASCGLPRATWTEAELATYLFQQTGISVRETPMREFCHRQQIRPYRPTSRYLRGAPQRQVQAQSEFTDLKKKRRRVPASC